MPGPRKPTADRVLDIAEALVQTRGYNAFSYADISRAVGVRKASLHHHYPTKADLGLALVSRYHAAFMGALSEIEGDASRESAAAVHDTCGVAKLRMVARTKIALIGSILPLYQEPLLFEIGTHPIAQFSLQFNAILGNCPAAAAGFFQLATEGLEEWLVVGQPVDHGNRLAAAALFLHPQLGDDAIGNGFLPGRQRLAALAVADRPATLRADTAAVSGVNEPGTQLGMKVNRARPLAVPDHGQSDWLLRGRASARTST